MIKAIFFDVDGTLLNHDDGSMSASTIKALKLLRENGIKLFVATGRPPNNLESVKKYFNFDGYLSSNGQYCFNDKEIIYEKYIEQDDIKNLFPYINDNKIPVLFAQIEDNYSNIVNYKLDELASSLNKPRYPVKKPEEIIGNKIVQVMAYIDEQDDEDFLSHMPHCKSARWTPLFADIIPCDGGKNAGIDKVIEYYNIDITETMAFGDGNNDIGMLKHVAIGVAMGNADDKVKGACDYITEDINNDGIYLALKHFELI